MMEISIVIPVHDIEKRWPTISKAICLAHDDVRIAEVILSCEPDTVLPIRTPKARTLHNEKREYVFRNKYLAVQRAKSEYVIILDSDNTIDKIYLNTIFNNAPWETHTIYQPEFAKPSFDFRQFAGQVIQKGNVRPFMQVPMFRVMMNAMNYFVHRETYLAANKETFDSCYDPKCADSLMVNYNLLKAGCRMYVVPGLQYDHQVHSGSFYKEAAPQYGYLTKEIEGKITSL